VSPAILAAGLLVAQQVAGKATRDAFFLSEFDVTAMPLMSGAAAIVSLLAVLAFARGMEMLSPGRMVPLAVALSAALLLGEWGLSGPLPRLAAVAVYFHTVIFGPTLLSGLWSLVNERFDPYSAKWAVGRIGAGASLGGLIGGLITWFAATLISVPTMLVGMAALSLLCLGPLFQLRPARPKAPPAAPQRSAAPAAKAVSGLRLIRDIPYLRDLAFLVGLCAFIEALLDYVFTASAAGSFARGAKLMSFFALFHTVVGFLTLGLQATLIRPSLGRLGLAGTLVVQPAAMALGSVVALFFPRLWPIVLIRGSQAALRNSLFRSAYELFYTPLPQEQKRSTKAIVDVGFDRLGTAAGSAVMMGVLFLAPAGPTRVLLALAAASAGLAVTLAPRFDHGYVTALKQSLRMGAVTLDAVEVVDATTRLAVSAFEGAPPQPMATLTSEEPLRRTGPAPVLADPLLEAAADLRSRDPRRIRKVLETAELDSRLVSDVIPLLGRDDLFGAVVKTLRKVAPRCTGQLIDALLEPGQEAVVRRRIPRVLRATPTQRAANGLLLGLRDERLDLRYRCAQALVRMKEANPALAISRQEVITAALREIALGLHAGRSLDHVFSILSLVLEKELEIALRALRSGDAALRGTALEYLENVLPDAVRKGLWPHLGSPGRLAPSGRSHEEIRDDLLRSTVASRHSGLKRGLDTAG
jgi:ATP:ADP antiporter, AAA family